MYKSSDLIKLCMNLSNVTNEEYEYISKENIKEELLSAFQEKKSTLKNKIEDELKKIKLNENEKKEIREILQNTYEIELKIGNIYKGNLEDIKTQIINLNKEKKLQEVYAKSGMKFGIDNNLKDTKKI